MKVYLVTAVEEYSSSQAITVYRSRAKADSRVIELEQEKARWHEAMERSVHEPDFVGPTFSDYVTYSSFIVTEHDLL